MADSLDQAVEDLNRDWSAGRRPTWAIDSGTPTTDPVAVEANHRVAAPMRAALRRARLVAERTAVEAAVPPDPSAQITQLDRQREALQRRQEDLVAGREPHTGDPAARAALELRWAEQRVAAIEASLSRRGLPWRERRHLQGQAVEAERRLTTAQTRWAEVGQPSLDN